MSAISAIFGTFARTHPITLKLYQDIEDVILIKIANFWDFKCQLWPNDHNYGQFFFVIFDENDFLYILVEFESDRMSPRESAKNGRNGPHGSNWKIFVNSEFRFEIYNKNYPMKQKIHVSPTILEFLSPNLAGPNLLVKLELSVQKLRVSKFRDRMIRVNLMLDKLTLIRPLREKWRMRKFFDVSKV